MIAKTRGKLLCVLGSRVNNARAFASGTPIVATPGFDGMFVRAHRETHFVRQNSIVANEAQTAAPTTSPARVGNHLETFHPGGKFRFDDFDGCCLAIAQMKGRGRDSIFAATRAGAAAKDFIVHIGPVAIGVVPAQNQSGAAGAAGNSFLGSEGSQGS